MRISAKLTDLTVRALAESIDVQTMTILANKIFDNYNLNERTGFPESIPIPNRDAAKQIVNDMKHDDIFPQFVNLLIEIHQTGLMGRKYEVSHLRQIIKEVYDLGYIYDQEYKTFIEDPNVRKTKNWGVLRELEEYIFTFLRLDIAGNSKLVRKYPEDIIQATYSDLRKIVQEACENRNGRIWDWEGDGGTVAFYFSNKNNLAVLSAMEIIHEIYIYNLHGCRLEEDLQVRIAVHSGLCQFRYNFENVKSDTIKEIIEIEAKHTKPNSVTLSNIIYPTLDIILTDGLDKIKADAKTSYYNYRLKWEN